MKQISAWPMILLLAAILFLIYWLRPHG